MEFTTNRCHRERGNCFPSIQACIYSISAVCKNVHDVHIVESYCHIVCEVPRVQECCNDWGSRQNQHFAAIQILLAHVSHNSMSRMWLRTLSTKPVLLRGSSLLWSYLSRVRIMFLTQEYLEPCGISHYSLFGVAISLGFLRCWKYWQPATVDIGKTTQRIDQTDKDMLVYFIKIHVTVSMIFFCWFCVANGLKMYHTRDRKVI